LTVDGAVLRPLQLGWQDLMALPHEDQASDFHCVTSWSQMDLRFEGVALATVLALAEPVEGASHLMLHAYDGYTTNLSLAEACKPDVLLAHRVDGEPLPREHGGPLRVVTPQLYAWKGAKWVCRLEVLMADRPGFWEQRGYSMTAHPWRDDRYG
jgi:DMSO/TMAO reductase YedYZ molybdopterin-dependent catalytic subunit